MAPATPDPATTPAHAASRVSCSSGVPHADRHARSCPAETHRSGSRRGQPSHPNAGRPHPGGPPAAVLTISASALTARGTARGNRSLSHRSCPPRCLAAHQQQSGREDLGSDTGPRPRPCRCRSVRRITCRRNAPGLPRGRSLPRPSSPGSSHPLVRACRTGSRACSGERACSVGSERLTAWLCWVARGGESRTCGRRRAVRMPR